jgi:nitrogen regulatory protein PII
VKRPLAFGDAWSSRNCKTLAQVQMRACVGDFASIARDPGLFAFRGRAIMKLIVAVIKPFKLDEVRTTLDRLGVKGMTVSEANGYGRQKGHTEIYRGSEYNVAFMPKVRLEIAVSDHEVESTIEAIQATARTGQIGDGKIFVLPIERAMRIRTAETGDEAL